MVVGTEGKSHCQSSAFVANLRPVAVQTRVSSWNETSYAHSHTRSKAAILCDGCGPPMVLKRTERAAALSGPHATDAPCGAASLAASAAAVRAVPRAGAAALGAAAALAAARGWRAARGGDSSGDATGAGSRRARFLAEALEGGELLLEVWRERVRCW